MTGKLKVFRRILFSSASIHLWQSKMAEGVTFLTCIWEIPVLILGWISLVPVDKCRDSSLIRPRPLPLTNLALVLQFNVRDIVWNIDSVVQ
jgi:hypothetical protein